MQRESHCLRCAWRGAGRNNQRCRSDHGNCPSLQQHCRLPDRRQIAFLVLVEISSRLTEYWSAHREWQHSLDGRRMRLAGLVSATGDFVKLFI